MKTVTASITLHFDYSDSIQALQDERKEEGLAPMTDEEIREWVENDLHETNYNELPPTPEISITEEP